MIVRGYRSLGTIDPNACLSLSAANAAGFAVRDAYLFPCPKCKTTPKQQLRALVAFLQTCPSAWSGRIWLDIEGPSMWLGNKKSNEAWYRDLVNACVHGGIKCGVYSSPGEWGQLFPRGFSYGKWLPLWYAHYDNMPSFSDWPSVAFGGWKQVNSRSHNHA